LRLIARLPAPAGLEDRLNAGLRSAPRRAPVLAWPHGSPLAGAWMRGAAAAAIVCVVAGGGWGICSRVQPAQGIVAPQNDVPAKFSSSEAIRRPQTLEGPVVKDHGPAAMTPKPRSTAAAAQTKATNPKSKLTKKPAPVQHALQ
jgi:hypothetical protein